MSTLDAMCHETDVQRQHDLYSDCGTSDGTHFCTCQCESTHSLSCMLYRRKIEPLAFSLSQEQIILQVECALLNGLPREVRQMIWCYALTDTTTVPASGTSRWREGRFGGGPSDLKFPTPDVVFALLRTCKIIYLETYTIPLQINNHIVYGFRGPSRPDLKLLAPWQAALIQRLDISLTQMALEQGELRNWLVHWHANKRHQGAYIAPIFKDVENNLTKNDFQPFPFSTTSIAAGHDRKDGKEVTLPIPPSSPGTFYKKTTSATQFSARVMIARPLTHLTLRMCHKDWWTWSDDPARTAHPPGQLSLDPAVGRVDGSVWKWCNVELMQELSDKRRAGENIQANGTWGAIVGRLPDLKELTLVLETFDVKQDQLERVVERAKTWQFPIEDTPFTLAWDGMVEDASWNVEPGEVEKAIAKLAAEDEEWEERRKAAALFQSEFSEEEELDDSQVGSDEESEIEEEEQFVPRSPSWDMLCKRFEVRVIRFVRRKM